MAKPVVIDWVGDVKMALFCFVAEQLLLFIQPEPCKLDVPCMFFFPEVFATYLNSRFHKHGPTTLPGSSRSVIPMPDRIDISSSFCSVPRPENNETSRRPATPSSTSQGSTVAAKNPVESHCWKTALTFAWSALTLVNTDKRDREICRIASLLRLEGLKVGIVLLSVWGAGGFVLLCIAIWHHHCLLCIWWPPCPMESLLANLKPESNLFESGLQTLDVYLVWKFFCKLRHRVATQNGFVPCMFFTDLRDVGLQQHQQNSRGRRMIFQEM